MGLNGVNRDDQGKQSLIPKDSLPAGKTSEGHTFTPSRGTGIGGILTRIVSSIKDSLGWGVARQMQKLGASAASLYEKLPGLLENITDLESKQREVDGLDSEIRKLEARHPKLAKKCNIVATAVLVSAIQKGIAEGIKKSKTSSVDSQERSRAELTSPFRPISVGNSSFQFSEGPDVESSLLSEQAEAYEQRLESLRGSIESLKENNTLLSQELNYTKGLEAKMKRLEGQDNAVKSKLEDMVQENKELRSKLELLAQKSNEAEPSGVRVDSSSKPIATQGEIKRLREENQSMRTLIEELEGQVSKNDRSVQEVAKLKGKLTVVEKELATVKGYNEELDAGYAELTEKLRLAKQEIAILRDSSEA
ncbi:MAG: hypothetical protein WCG42_07415 [Parachlamydiaceae bacterium]